MCHCAVTQCLALIDQLWAKELDTKKHKGVLPQFAELEVLSSVVRPLFMSWHSCTCTMHYYCQFISYTCIMWCNPEHQPCNKIHHCVWLYYIYIYSMQVIEQVDTNTAGCVNKQLLTNTFYVNLKHDMSVWCSCRSCFCCGQNIQFCTNKSMKDLLKYFRPQSSCDCQWMTAKGLEMFLELFHHHPQLI